MISRIVKAIFRSLGRPVWEMVYTAFNDGTASMRVPITEPRVRAALFVLLGVSLAHDLAEHGGHRRPAAFGNVNEMYIFKVEFFCDLCARSCHGSSRGILWLWYRDCYLFRPISRSGGLHCRCNTWLWWRHGHCDRGRHLHLICFADIRWWNL